MATLASLVADVRACRRCADLPCGPRPVLQVHASARILVAAQAPGRKVHESGVPFADASGERLRRWLGLDEATFYDARRVAILPMGFCFPGTGASGDLPPRPECARQWRAPLLAQLRRLRLTLVFGRYAQAWHLGDRATPLTELVAAGGGQGDVVVLPHPSPRNNRWLKRHPWFEAEVVPRLRARVAQALA